MKIAVIDDNDVVYGYAAGDPLAAGGAERYEWLLIRALAARGWSATVGVRAALKPGERVKIDGVEFVGIGDGQILLALFRFLVSEKPDWCHWAGATHLLGPAMVIAKIMRTRTVYSAQFDLDVHPRQALYARPRLWPLFALGLAGSNKIFLQHRGQYLELPSWWQSKAYVIPGVVKLPAVFKSHHQRDRYVAWVGVLRQPKRPDLLIEVARRAPTVDFVVCGGPSDHRSPPGYSAAMIDRFQQVPNIRYLGHVAPAGALEVIANASLLLSTSEGEGFPSVFLEAWAHGTPVASLKIDPDALIARKQLGIMCSGVEAAAVAISDLVGSVERREEIALRCRDYVAQCHSGTAAVASVESALNGGAAPLLRPFETPEQS